jgi:hypothetical protein
MSWSCAAAQGAVHETKREGKPVITATVWCQPAAILKQRPCAAFNSTAATPALEPLPLPSCPNPPPPQVHTRPSHVRATLWHSPHAT